MSCREWAALLLASLLAVGPARAANPHALWRIVHDRCVPHQQLDHDPAPCALVDLAGGFAVLKDIVGREQFLLIPIARLSGIESSALLSANAPNYFADAWAQRPLVATLLHRPLPREDVALAINSAYGRTQNQLHIHIDCIGIAVHEALAAASGFIGKSWTELPTPLAGHRYRAMRIAGEGLGETNPFRLLAASLKDPTREMGEHTLVLVGVDSPAPGFILLDDHVDLLRLDRASGEALEDHSCAIAQRSDRS